MATISLPPRSQTELLQRCIQRGFPEGEFVLLFAGRAALADQEEMELPWNP